MQYTNQITLEGIVFDEPKTIEAGSAGIMKFTLKHTHFKRGGVEENLYLRVDAWTDSTKIIGDDIEQYCIVSATGRLKQERWVDNIGQKRYAYTLVASTLDCKGKHAWKPKEDIMMSDEELAAIPF